jgi:hypothetical protein
MAVKMTFGHIGHTTDASGLIVIAQKSWVSQLRKSFA